eukprot:10816874-Alexandrium_andersonii.AAC.1
MPARLREVEEYIRGHKRTKAFRIWVEQRRQEALRDMRAAARANAEDVDAGAESEDCNETTEPLHVTEA